MTKYVCAECGRREAPEDSEVCPRCALVETRDLNNEIVEIEADLFDYDIARGPDGFLRCVPVTDDYDDWQEFEFEKPCRLCQVRLALPKNDLCSRCEKKHENAAQDFAEEISGWSGL